MIANTDNNDKATSNDNDNKKKDDTEQMSEKDTSKSTSISYSCANCGKGEECAGSLKVCFACKMVKYCNRECQIAHWPQHKKACKKRAAELHDIELFKQPPSMYGDCPICMLPLPPLDSGSRYNSCCGKVICSGCVCAPVFNERGKVIKEKRCAFCREPVTKSNEEMLERMAKLINNGDANSICNMGTIYADGWHGLPQNRAKALELWHRAAELGDATSYRNIGNAYSLGRGVERNEKKAKHYYELAAIGGNVVARYNLGCFEKEAGNYGRALKHYMIAVNFGDNRSLENIKAMYAKPAGDQLDGGDLCVEIDED